MCCLCLVAANIVTYWCFCMLEANIVTYWCLRMVAANIVTYWCLCVVVPNIVTYWCLCMVAVDIVNYWFLCMVAANIVTYRSYLKSWRSVTSIFLSLYDRLSSKLCITHCYCIEDSYVTSCFCRLVEGWVVSCAFHALRLLSKLF
jgi:hypothetical protein